MILAVDPSVRHVGWATFSRFTHKWQHGTINIPPGMELEGVLIHLVFMLNKEMRPPLSFNPLKRPSELIVEYPEFHGGTTKGATAAAKGTTFGLAAIAGYLQGYYQMPAKNTFFYKPSKWKGQVPKKGMEYRFKQLFGYDPKTDHEAEAALMLQYHLDQTS